MCIPALKMIELNILTDYISLYISSSFWLKCPASIVFSVLSNLSKAFRLHSQKWLWNGLEGERNSTLQYAFVLHCFLFLICISVKKAAKTMSKKTKDYVHENNRNKYVFWINNCLWVHIHISCGSLNCLEKSSVIKWHFKVLESY